MGRLYSDLWLYDDIDAVVVAPSLKAADKFSLVIERKSGEISLREQYAGRSQPKRVYGLVGIIQLRLDRYLIAITGRRSLGVLDDEEIYALTDLCFCSIRFPDPHPVQDADEKALLALVDAHLRSAPLFFSYTGDTTNTVARKHGIAATTPMWQRVCALQIICDLLYSLQADERFFWNRHLQDPLIQFRRKSKMTEADWYILPMCYGCKLCPSTRELPFSLLVCEIRRTILKHHNLILGLISRRSRYRAGTRYFSRGIDAEGNVANYNETEQVVMVDGYIMSYVQIRGSIPLAWAEVISLKYKPSLRIFGSLDNHLPVLRSHLDEQIKLYGDVLCLNLINAKGHERPIKDAYEQAIVALKNPRVTYYYFDFHDECSGLNWHRIHLLLDRLQETLLSQGYFSAKKDTSTVLTVQQSVIRTNCMDCLDRTNVVQSSFAAWMLTRQLQSAGVLTPDESIADFPHFHLLYRNLWADNADILSKSYSGTGALKTDFTRYGKRTRRGPLLDLSNSIVRYIKNTYFDGLRQDSFDLVLGNYESGESLYPLFVDDRSIIVQSIPYILYTSFLMILIALLLPRAQDAKLPIYIFLIFWIIVLGFSVQYLLANGNQYVQWPALVPLEYAPNARPLHELYEKPKRRDFARTLKAHLLGMTEDVEMGTTPTMMGGTKTE